MGISKEELQAIVREIMVNGTSCGMPSSVASEHTGILSRLTEKMDRSEDDIDEIKVLLTAIDKRLASIEKESIERNANKTLTNKALIGIGTIISIVSGFCGAYLRRGNTMRLKHVIGLVMALIMSGCATPSEVYRTFDGQGNMLTESIKYDNSSFIGGKLVGLSITPFDPVTYAPSIKLLYGRYEGGRINKGQVYLSSFRMRDISLIQAKGQTDSNIAIFDGLYLDKMQTKYTIESMMNQ